MRLYKICIKNPIISPANRQQATKTRHSGRAGVGSLMPIDPEALYRQLGQLVAETPGNLAGPGDLSPETHHWLGRAAALIGELRIYVGPGTTAGTMVLADQVSFNSASDGLVGILREQNAHRIIAILHRALACAELKAPAAAQGAFIPVGAAFDALQVIGKVFSEATREVFIIDPYMDAKVLTDFALLAPERVAIRLLTDSFSTKPEALQPAATRWVQQYGALRPLETRLTAPRALHDRLISIDGAHVWSLTQSLKDMAGRSPASVLRVEADLGRMKIDAYEQFWAGANPL